MKNKEYLSNVDGRGGSSAIFVCVVDKRRQDL